MDENEGKGDKEDGSAKQEMLDKMRSLRTGPIFLMSAMEPTAIGRGGMQNWQNVLTASIEPPASIS